MKNLATMMQGGSIPGMEGLEDAFKGGRKVSQCISRMIADTSIFIPRMAFLVLISMSMCLRDVFVCNQYCA